MSHLKPPKDSKQVAFSGGAGRWSKGPSLKAPEDEKIVPGPGFYEQMGIADSASVKLCGKSGVFGSTERRFVNQNNLRTPGPG